jgi:hypothetical protein
MYSAKNNLKVWVSNFSYPYMAANTDTLSNLPAGAIGFYTEAGVLLPDGTGTGFIAFRKPNGQVLRSKSFTSAVTWLNRRKVYTAPTLGTQTLTVTAVASTVYQVELEFLLPGLGQSYMLHGNYKSAASGDDATAIAAALTLSLNNALIRTQKTEYFTITSALGVITIVTKLRPYVRGKLQGHPVWFKSRVTLPEAQAALGTQTVAPVEGVGYAPYIAEKEFFAQGDSDAFRFNSWPNSFDDRGLLAIKDATLAQYDVVPFNINSPVGTNNADVNANQDYLVCFNSIGVTPTPIMTGTYAAGNVTPTGWAVPGSTVTLYKGGVATGTPVTAHATTGAVTYGSTAVLEGDILTFKAVDGSAAASAASNSKTVTA